MPATDNCKPQIINALQKDGWRILEKPFIIRTNKHMTLADFSMQRGVNGRSEQIIVLEVKCFANPKTDLQEFYTALGQYEFYREALRKKQTPLPLYLAIPHSAYERLISDSNIKSLLKNTSVKIVTVNLEQEEVVQWIT